MFEVNVELGLQEPLPPYFGEWQVARWMGITRDALQDMPIHEVEEARIVMSALNRAQDDANRKARKK